MWTHNLMKTCAVVAILALTVAPALAKEKKDTITIDIEDSDGSKASISLTTDLVSGVLEGMIDEDLECEGDIESDTREMLEYLSQKGKGSRYTLEKEDGEIIKAHRRKDQLELKILGDDEDPIHVSMPWILAECMLGNRVAAKELEKADGLRFSVKKDGGVELRVE
jgi:hypothetical protein